MQAFADHGEVEGDQVTTKYAEAQQVMDDLAKVGIDYDDVIEVLENEGVDKFVKSWDELSATVEDQMKGGQVSETFEVVATGAAADAISARVPALVEDGFAGKLFAKDPTLWGPDAEEEAGKRLSWVTLPQSSRPLVGEIAALRAELADAGVDHVVLCGMGGSSLAPEVICATHGVELTVLDSSFPDQVRAALAGPARAHRRGRLQQVRLHRGDRLAAAGLRAGVHRRRHRPGVADRDRHRPRQPAGQAVPRGRLPRRQRRPRRGRPLLRADRLRPGALAGSPAPTSSALLDEADAVSDLLAEDDEANPGLRLGAAIAGTSPLRNKLVLVDQGSGLQGFADWAEQLVAESTGKQGTGLLPVVVADDSAPEVALPPHDVTVVHLADDTAPDPHVDPAEADAGSAGSDVVVTGTLGAQMLLWEVATADRRPAAGHRPLRPARRGERQDRRPLDAGGLARTPRRPTSPTGPSRSARSAATGSAAPRPQGGGRPRCSSRSTASRATSR